MASISSHSAGHERKLSTPETFAPGTPADELAGFLAEQSGANTINPQNPLGQGAVPSANKANPLLNPSNPNAFNNPSNPNTNPDLPGAATNPSNPEFNPSMPSAQNNPSNPMRNPSNPGALTNPSNPQLNPAYPGSITNPSNPIHNPDYPNPEGIGQPPNPMGPNASFPPYATSAWRFADDTTMDSRNFADPLEPRPSKPPLPTGCTCQDGHKLDCPIHGMHPEKPDLDHAWSLPEGSPVGYPQDQPRGWQQAVASGEGGDNAADRDVDDYGQQHDEEGENEQPAFVRDAAMRNVMSRGAQDEVGIGEVHSWDLSKLASARQPHPNIDTGLPCFCGFNRGHVAKTSAKLQDFLMNPKSRPDLQTPEAQAFLHHLEHHYHNEKTDALMPWVAREWKKGRLAYDPDPMDAEDAAFNNVPPGETRDYQASLRIPELHAPSERVYHHVAIKPSDLNHWADFLQSNHPLKREMGDIMKHDVHSLFGRINDWDADMAAKAHTEALEGGRVVHTTPEGYTIRQLETPEQLKAEGNAMGHCVGGRGYAQAVQDGRTLIYSLRDPKNAPHATVEITPTRFHYPPDEQLPPELQGLGMGDAIGDEHTYNNTPIPHGGEIVQVQGKEDTLPKPEYQQQLKHWFTSFPEEDRPNFEQETGPIRHIGELHPGAMTGHQYGESPWDPEDDYGIGRAGDYGLVNNARHRPIDYGDVIDSLNRPHTGYEYRSGGYSYDPAETETLYNEALRRGEIPQLGKATEKAGTAADEELMRRGDWDDEEYRYPGEAYEEDPSRWDAEAEDYPQHFDTGQDAFDQTKKLYDEEQNERYADHNPSQIINNLYQRLNQHAIDTNPETGQREYANWLKPHDEPQPGTFSHIGWDLSKLSYAEYDPRQPMLVGLPRPIGQIPMSETSDGGLAPVPWSQNGSQWGDIEPIRAHQANTEGLCLVCGEPVQTGKVFVISDPTNPATITYTLRSLQQDRAHRVVVDQGPMHDQCAALTGAHCPVAKEKLAVGGWTVMPFEMDSTQANPDQLTFSHADQSVWPLVADDGEAYIHVRPRQGSATRRSNVQLTARKRISELVGDREARLWDFGDLEPVQLHPVALDRLHDVVGVGSVDDAPLDALFDVGTWRAAGRGLFEQRTMVAQALAKQSQADGAGIGLHELPSDGGVVVGQETVVTAALRPRETTACAGDWHSVAHDDELGVGRSSDIEDEDAGGYTGSRTHTAGVHGDVLARLSNRAIEDEDLDGVVAKRIAPVGSDVSCHSTALLAAFASPIDVDGICHEASLAAQWDLRKLAWGEDVQAYNLDEDKQPGVQLLYHNPYDQDDAPYGTLEGFWRQQLYDQDHKPTGFGGWQLNFKDQWGDRRRIPVENLQGMNVTRGELPEPLRHLQGQPQGQLAEGEPAIDSTWRMAMWRSPEPVYGGTWEDVKKHVRQPWQPGQWGKGIISPLGRPITWNAIKAHGLGVGDQVADGWPAHTDVNDALGYMDNQGMFGIKPTGELRYCVGGGGHQAQQHINQIAGTNHEFSQEGSDAARTEAQWPKTAQAPMGFTAYFSIGGQQHEVRGVADLSGYAPVDQGGLYDWVAANDLPEGWAYHSIDPDSLSLHPDEPRQAKIAMPYDEPRDATWHSGGCGEYAIALQQRHPELSFGVQRDDEDPDYLQDREEGYDVVAPVKHVFAHDDHFAYDVYGKHPLPYDGGDISRQWTGEYDIPEQAELAGHLPWDLDSDPQWGIDAAHRHIDQYGDPTTDEYNRMARTAHNLWWKPGVAGRGLLSPEGELHTWPEDEMTHEQRLQQLGVKSEIGASPEGWERLDIRPNAAVPVWFKAQGDQIQSIDSRLRPTISPYIWDSVNQRAMPNPEYEAKQAHMSGEQTSATPEDLLRVVMAHPIAPGDCTGMAQEMTRHLAEAGYDAGTAGDTGHTFTMVRHPVGDFIVDAWPDGKPKIWPRGQVPMSEDPSAYQVDPTVWGKEAALSFEQAHIGSRSPHRTARLTGARTRGHSNDTASAPLSEMTVRPRVSSLPRDGKALTHSQFRSSVPTHTDVVVPSALHRNSEWGTDTHGTVADTLSAQASAQAQAEAWHMTSVIAMSAPLLRHKRVGPDIGKPFQSKMDRMSDESGSPYEPLTSWEDPTPPSTLWHFHFPGMEDHIMQQGLQPTRSIGFMNTLGDGAYGYDHDPSDIHQPGTGDLYQLDMQGLENRMTPDYEIEGAWHYPEALEPSRVRRIAGVPGTPAGSGPGSPFEQVMWRGGSPESGFEDRSLVYATDDPQGASQYGDPQQVHVRFERPLYHTHQQGGGSWRDQLESHAEGSWPTLANKYDGIVYDWPNSDPSNPYYAGKRWAISLKPGLVRRTAALYHVTPTTERQRIKTWGLQPADPYHDNGATPEDWDEFGGPGYRPPSGVYGWPTLDQAQEWVRPSERDGMDVWEFPDDHSLEDPDQPGARYVPHSVNPKLVWGPEHWAKTASVVPPDPGTSPIPPGNVRLWHYTGADPEQIRQQGLRLDAAKGESYGEPNQVWASARPPGFDNHNVVEFSVPRDDPRWGIGKYEPYINYAYPDGDSREDPNFDYGDYLKQRGAHVTFNGDIRPEEIHAIHEPWHETYRYLKQHYPAPTNEFDSLAQQDPNMGKAIQQWKLGGLDDRPYTGIPQDEMAWHPAPVDTMYHVAPASVTDNIAQTGLQLPEGGSPYVWMFADQGVADQYAQNSERFRPQQVWTVNTTGMPVSMDPHPGNEATRAHGWVTRDPVPADRLSR